MLWMASARVLDSACARARHSVCSSMETTAMNPRRLCGSGGSSCGGCDRSHWCVALRQRVAWQGSKIEGEGARFYTSGFTRLFFVLATSFLHCRSDRNKPRLSLRLAPVRASFPRSAVCENMSTASAVCLYKRIHWSFCITYHPNAPREPRERHGSTISTPENTCYGFHQCASSV